MVGLNAEKTYENLFPWPKNSTMSRPQYAQLGLLLLDLELVVSSTAPVGVRGCILREGVGPPVVEDPHHSIQVPIPSRHFSANNQMDL